MVMSVLCDYRVVSNFARSVGTYATAVATTTDSVSCCFPFLLSLVSLLIVVQTRSLHKVVGHYSSFVRSVAVVCTNRQCGSFFL
jgi:hypothetical protein